MAAERKRGLDMPIPDIERGAPAPPDGSRRVGAMPVPTGIHESRHLQLLCGNGVKPGTRYPLAPGLTRIGRADPDLSRTPDVDLGGQEDGEARRSVSRQHAEITQYPEGLELVDLGSANGTWLNDVRLMPGVPGAVRPGDHIRIGRLELVLERASD